MKKNTLRDLVIKAKKKALILEKQRRSPKYQRAMQWLGFTGLIQHNKINPRQAQLTLRDLLYTAKIEPRALELLPAILIVLKEALPFPVTKLSPELVAVIEAVNSGTPPPPLYHLEPQQYLQWFDAPVMEIAHKRLSPRAKPRWRNQQSSDIGDTIRSQRLKLGFTQTHFSQTFGTSLRALRDLEQGTQSVSIERTNAILAPFGLELGVLQK